MATIKGIAPGTYVRHLATGTVCRVVRYDQRSTQWQVSPLGETAEWFVWRDTIRPINFLEFCFMRTGFGLTAWPQFIVIQVATWSIAMLGFPIGVIPWAVINAGLVWGTWRNFNGRQG